jgi:hypothetical protein
MCGKMSIFGAVDCGMVRFLPGSMVVLRMPA